MSTSGYASSYAPNLEVGPAIISHATQDPTNTGTHQQPRGGGAEHVCCLGAEEFIHSGATKSCCHRAAVAPL